MNKIDIQRVRNSYTELFHAAKSLNKARDELRKTANNLAGTNLDDWSLQDISKWIDLGVNQVLKTKRA